MKQINAILRTLCLAALLCVASVNASAYKIYSAGTTSVVLPTDEMLKDNDKILVIKENVSLKNFTIGLGYAVVIEYGANVTVTENFANGRGKLYVYGYLTFASTCYALNAADSDIYARDGHLSGNLDNVGNMYPYITCSSGMIAGNFPVTPTSGWGNYWMKGIRCDNDFYPAKEYLNPYGEPYYYSDEACTAGISLEHWKSKEGRIKIDLGLKIGGAGGYDNWEYWDTDEKKGFLYNDDLALEGSQSYEAKSDFNLTGTFTFTRDLSPVIGKWQAWYEPFEVELTPDVLANMDAAQIAGMLTDAEGNTVIAFKKMKESEVMKANTPYVIRFKDESGSLKLEYNSGKTMYKSAENSCEFSSMYDNFEIGGIYTAKGNSNWYALSKDGAFKKMNGTPPPTLQPQRIWLTVTPRTDSPYYSPTTKSIVTKSTGTPDVIRIVILGDDGKPEDGSDIKPIREAQIINADGQGVNRIQRGQVYRVSGNINK